MSRAQSIDDRVLTAPAALQTSYTGLTLYATACAVVLGTILLTNWPSYAFAARGGVIPLYYYIVACALCIPIVFAHPEVVLRVLRDRLFWWFAIYVLLGLVWQIGSQDFSDEPNKQLRVRLMMFCLFTAIAVLCAASRRPVIAWVIILCVLLGGAFNWFDALRPFRFVPQGHDDATEGRGAGLFINPNVAGAFAVMGTIAALPFIPMRFRGTALMAAVMCLAPTFSRGAFVLVAVAAFSAMGLRMLSRFQSFLVVIALPLLVLGINVAYDYLMTHSEDRNMQLVVQRLLIFTESGEEDESVEGRADAAARAWVLFKESPLVGVGLGKTTSVGFVIGPHNMYAMLMAEQGLFGLALYLSLLFLLAKGGWRLRRSAPTQQGVDVGNAMIMLALFFAANGLFSHNVLDEVHAMFIIAFLVGARIQEQQMAELAAPVHAIDRLQRFRPAPRLMRW